MIDNIESIYANNLDDKQILLGKSYIENEKLSKVFYVGWEFDLDDILSKDTNRNALRITDKNAFKRLYYENNAVGIIYFPQLNTYKFKNINDVVVRWEYGMSNEDVNKLLDEKVQEYINNKKKRVSRISEIIDLLEDDDPLLELFDVPTLSRKQKHSTR